MPPRHVYWTIIYGNQATSFRAATHKERLPTLKQLQSRHPDAVLKYFARGRLWNSAEEARAPYDDRRRDHRWDKRPRQAQPREDRPRQDRPRDDRWNKGPQQDRPRQERPPGDRWNKGPGQDQPREDRPRQDRPPGDRWNKGPQQDRPRQERPRDDRRPLDRPRES